MSSPLLPSRRVLLEAVVLVAVAAAAGLSLNYPLIMNAFSGRHVIVAPRGVSPNPTVKFPLPVDFSELDGLIAAGYQLVDARDRHLYDDAHLPGAVALPIGEVDAQLAGFTARFPFNIPLILYCNGFGCPDSFDLGVRLLAEGYQTVRVYEGGFPEWRDRGRPLERGGTK